MTQNGEVQVPRWYWIVAALALLFEAMGCYAYLTHITMSEAELAALPPAQAELFRAMPVWVSSAYAVAVWVGASGAIGLLMRQRWARECLLISLIAMLVQFGWTFLATPALRTLGADSAIFPAVIVLFATVLFLFSALARRRGWLR